MQYVETTEDFFKRMGYGLNTSVAEALAIKERNPAASNAEIAKMNILSKRDAYAAAGNWGMYSVTVSNLLRVYGLLGDYEQELECLLQTFYMTLSAGRQYTPALISQIASAAEKCNLELSGVVEKYEASVGMLPSLLVPVASSEYAAMLRNDLVGAGYPS